jgi:hypothetical protein
LKLVDRLVIHGTIIGAVGLIALAVLGYATCRAKVAGIRQQRREGIAFGAAHTWPDCVSEALRRNGRRALGPKELAEKQRFLSACLAQTTEPAGTCAALPQYDDYPAASIWAGGFCADAGVFSEWNCRPVVSQILLACDLRRDGGLAPRGEDGD